MTEHADNSRLSCLAVAGVPKDLCLLQLKPRLAVVAAQIPQTTRMQPDTVIYYMQSETSLLAAVRESSAYHVPVGWGVVDPVWSLPAPQAVSKDVSAVAGVSHVGGLSASGCCRILSALGACSSTQTQAFSPPTSM